MVTAAPRALIVAAGVGRRLGPHTRRRPKPLIYVAGRPILAHLLDPLPAVGITDVVVVVGYLREQIEAYLRRAARPAGLGRGPGTRRSATGTRCTPRATGCAARS